MNNREETNQTVYITYNNADLSVSSFISYLLAALYSQGINAVSDKTGNKLESNRCSEIKVFLVVLSNSYASEACVENLVNLLEFLHKGHVVVPVFYDAVERKQIEIFGEAFAMLEKSYSADQVAKWRCALAKTMELPGYGYTDELRKQSELVEAIARGVFEKLNPTEQIGIHRVLPELDNLLCKQPWGFRSIGICGAPGIGKTTLAKAAFRKMSGFYDASHFIVEANEKIVELLSDADFQDIATTKFDLNNQDDKPCYRRKRVIYAVDDVRNIQDVRSFLRGFGPGSLLILTSRDRRVLEEWKVNEIYELKGLNKEDSLKLFTRCCYGEDVVEQELSMSTLKKIESYDGNPLNIRSYATEMKSKKAIDMQPALGKRCQDSFINIEKIHFQVTTSCFKQSLFFSAAHNYQSDLEKLWELDKFVSDVMALKLDLSGLESLPNPIRIPHFGQESVLAFQLSEPWEEFKSLSDYTSEKSIVVSDQQEPIQVLNLSGCIEIKHFPEIVETINELEIEGKLLEWRLRTDPLCPLCESANGIGSHLYFSFTFCWSIGTNISNRFQVLVKHIGSKAMKILSRMIHLIHDNRFDKEETKNAFEILVRTSSSP